MDTIHWIKIAFNTATTVILIFVLFYLQFALKPFQSGFYCNDYSISLKYHTSTVNNEVLVMVSLAFTFIVIFLSEFAEKTHIKINR